MYRSLLTSQYLQRELGINPEIWVDVHEVKGCRINNTSFSGLTRNEIRERFSGFIIPEEITDHGWFLNEIPETEEEGWERAGTVWERLKRMSNEDKYQGKSIIIVTHGLFLDFLFGRLCNRSMKGGNIYIEPRFKFFNTGYSLVWIVQNRPIIYFLDRIEHLTATPTIYREGELE